LQHRHDATLIVAVERQHTAFVALHQHIDLTGRPWRAKSCRTIGGRSAKDRASRHMGEVFLLLPEARQRLQNRQPFASLPALRPLPCAGELLQLECPSHRRKLLCWNGLAFIPRLFRPAHHPRKFRDHESRNLPPRRLARRSLQVHDRVTPYIAQASLTTLQATGAP